MEPDLAARHAALLTSQLASLMNLPPEVQIRALLKEAAEEATFGLVEEPANQHVDVVERLKLRGARIAEKRRRFVTALIGLVNELEEVLAGSRTSKVGRPGSSSRTGPPSC